MTCPQDGKTMVNRRMLSITVCQCPTCYYTKIKLHRTRAVKIENHLAAVSTTGKETLNIF